MLRRRVVGPACVALVIAGAVGCAHGPGVPDDDGGGHPVAAPAPRDRIVEASLLDPDAAWSRLQRGAGATFAVLPPTVGGLACALLGVDPGLGAVVDGHATAYAIVARRAAGGPAPTAANGGDFGWVVALRLNESGAQRVATALAGAHAGFAERIEGGVRLLSRAPPLPAAVGIARGWLLVGRDERDLIEMGAYVFETLPGQGRRPSAASLVARVPRDALAGPVAEAASSRWAAVRAFLLDQGRSERERHGGRAPDFADPEAIVETLERAVRERLTVIGGARELSVEAETGVDDVVIDLRAVGADATASTTGDASPLGDAPADAPLALLVRDDADQRGAAARTTTAALARVLGPRLKDVEARAIDAALDAWNRGRGDWMAVGAGGAKEGGFWLRAPAARDEAASQAVRQVLELSRLAVLRAPLAEWIGRLPAVFGPPGKASIATFPATGRLRPAAGVAWGVAGGDITIAAGREPLEQWTLLTSPGAKWADDARTARVLAALGSSASFVALAQGAGLEEAASVASAPLALAVGRRGGDPWARLDLADEVVAAGVRLAGARSPVRP
jgi:hypothetical protein